MKHTPLKTFSSLRSTPGIREVPRSVPAPADVDPDGQANAARLRAGARPNENGFTCVRCLAWFPAGTHHACQRYADVIRNPETVAPIKGPMSAAEVVLLQQAGQL